MDTNYFGCQDVYVFVMMKYKVIYSRAPIYEDKPWDWGVGEGGGVNLPPSLGPSLKLPQEEQPFLAMLGSNFVSES